MKLIKFIGLSDYLLSNLENHKLNFSKVDSFNDPFEGIFRFQVSDIYENFFDFYINRYSGNPAKAMYDFTHIDEFNDKLNKTNNWRYENNAVACFSSDENLLDVLMWSHYAKSHIGICLVFESDELFFNHETPVSLNGIAITSVNKLYKVRYTDKYLSENPLDKELDANTFLTTKFTPWSYEKEYRYIAAASGLYYYPLNALKEIIFGLRLPVDKKAEIKLIADTVYPGIKLSEIHLAKKMFKFELADYKV